MKNVDELSRSRSISPAFTSWAWTRETLQFIISRLNLSQQGKPEPRPRTSIRRTNLLIVLGLLVMAVSCFEGRLALAQADAPCPLPAGVTVPADPPVTAQDVVDGSANLEQFTLAARNQFTGTGSEKPTPAQIAYTGCRLRQDGGPWRSGDIYLVTLTPDGRVYLHAKRMSLSAGKLKTDIYAGILHALGTPGAILAGLSSTDAAVRSDAVNRLTTFLESEPHAAFNLRGGISGHAASYVSVNARRPFVMLTGFDLNASHLADEVIDYGSPAITARDGGGPRDPETVCRRGVEIHRGNREKRTHDSRIPGGFPESQACLAGPERPLETRFRVHPHRRRRQQPDPVSRRISGSIGAPTRRHKQGRRYR